MIRTLLVDDEPLARAGLRALLAGEADVEIVGEACDGAEAVERILADRPDLVLLDVQMPGMDGLEVVRRIAAEYLPAIIFVTAHDRFAIQAFEVHALDYILKPPSGPRLSQSLERVRAARLLPDPHDPQAIAAWLEARGPAVAPLQWLAVRQRDHYLLLRSEEIAWIQAAGNYVEIHARGRIYLRRETLTELERRLDPDRFRRIHRSTLVNLQRIREISPDASGDFHVHLDTGNVLRLSRRFRDRVLPRA